MGVKTWPADLKMSNCRVVVIGDRGVGKTSLIKQFLGQQFQQERLRATYACSTDQVKTASVEGRQVTFIIEEINDHSDLGSVEDVDIWLLCFNIMSAPSLHSLYL